MSVAELKELFDAEVTGFIGRRPATEGPLVIALVKHFLGEAATDEVVRRALEVRGGGASSFMDVADMDKKIEELLGEEMNEDDDEEIQEEMAELKKKHSARQKRAADLLKSIEKPLLPPVTDPPASGAASSSSGEALPPARVRRFVPVPTTGVTTDFAHTLLPLAFPSQRMRRGRIGGGCEVRQSTAVKRAGVSARAAEELISMPCVFWFSWLGDTWSACMALHALGNGTRDLHDCLH